MEPTKKHPAIDKITGDICVSCKNKFRNEISVKEYRISGLQDKVFGYD